MKRAALFGMTAVILGAFGAHALKRILEPEMLKIFHTGVEYQFYHALALMGIGIMKQHFQSSYLKTASLFFTIGILLFSGSLYILSFKEFLAFLPLSIFGPITPVGGVFFILAWFNLFLFAKKHDFQ